MSENTKVAELPAKWQKAARDLYPSEASSVMAMLAERLEQALARQEAVEDDIIAAAELRGYRRRQEDEAAQEPVAWYLPSEDGYDSCFRDHRTITSCTGNPWAGWIPLYAAPPAAQAVGLEQFREAVNAWNLACTQEANSAMRQGYSRDVVESLEAKERQARDLLALIDQQANGAKAQADGGRIIGSRTIDGVHVIVVSPFSRLLDEQLFVRYDEYLAATQAGKGGA